MSRHKGTLLAEINLFYSNVRYNTHGNCYRGTLYKYYYYSSTKMGLVRNIKTICS